MSRFNIKSLDLNLLSVFVILWDTRSVSRTGDLLSLTQPAVSHALKRLRERIGDVLFVPGRHGIVPTPRAAELINPVREALEIISNAIRHRAIFDPAVSSVEYRVATTDWIESWLIPNLVELIHQDAPGIVIRSVPLSEPDTLRDQLEAGDIDLAISHEPVLGIGIRCEPLTEISFVTMIRRQDAPSERRFPLAMFLERPHVVFRMKHLGSARIDSALKAMGHARRVGAEVQTIYGMLATAARTGCICTVPAHMGGRYARMFGLSVHEPPVHVRPPHPLFHAWHARFEVDPALAWLLANVRQAVAPQDQP
ncbi:LysR family transcriptional regulator [Hydrogenophaga sp. 2FB]|uniref:LysR family transcriptional regulator n=1 Tax=Hydrogenophaga sp. 2FB TaxID=2502187 RepID=UPI0010F7C1A9|nr:LysR family transcriptional regulator [Hydrogenophaga sp. 2FB]